MNEQKKMSSKVIEIIQDDLKAFNLIKSKLNFFKIVLEIFKFYKLNTNWIESSLISKIKLLSD